MSSTDAVIDRKAVYASSKFKVHDGAVTSVVVRGTRIYTGGADTAVRVFDSKSKKMIKTFSGHDGPINQIAAPDGTFIFSASDDNTCRVWDEKSNSSIFTYSHHTAPVLCLQVVNKDRVFSGGRDASVRLWSRDKDTIKIFFKEGNHIPVTCLQATRSNLLFTADEAGIIRVWTMRGEVLREFHGQGLQGQRIECMQVATTPGRTSGISNVHVYCGMNDRLVDWAIEMKETLGDPPQFDVKKVRALTGRSGKDSRGQPAKVLCLWAVFEDAHNTNKPVVYIGSESGDLHMLLPTGRMKSAVNSRGAWTRVPNLKDYSFKGCSGAIRCVSVTNGRIYGGDSSGTLCIWREPVNMQKLRRLASSNKSMVSSASLGMSSSGSSSSSQSSQSASQRRYSMAVSQTASSPSISSRSSRPRSMYSNDSRHMSMPSSRSANDASSMVPPALRTAPVLSKPEPHPDDKEIGEDEDVDEDKICIICYSRRKNSLLYPCGHASVCFPCGKELVARKPGECPICRQKIKDVVRIFT